MDGNDIRLARVPLISWVKVEWYLPDRVMRQFGAQQHIDVEGIPKEFKRVDARGKGGTDWSHFHRIECDLWNRRREFIQEPLAVDSDPQRALAIYMTWYKTWARLYLVQAPQETPRTFYPRAPYERELLEFMQDTTETLAPLDASRSIDEWLAARARIMSLADDVRGRLHLSDYSSTNPCQESYACQSSADAGPPYMEYTVADAGPSQTHESYSPLWSAWPEPTSVPVGAEEEMHQELMLGAEEDMHQEATLGAEEEMHQEAMPGAVEEVHQVPPRRRHSPDRYTPGSNAVYRRRRRG